MFLVNALKVYLAPISKLEQIFLENHKLEFLFALHERSKVLLFSPAHYKKPILLYTIFIIMAQNLTKTSYIDIHFSVHFPLFVIA